MGCPVCMEGRSNHAVLLEQTKHASAAFFKVKFPPNQISTIFSHFKNFCSIPDRFQNSFRQSCRVSLRNQETSFTVSNYLRDGAHIRCDHRKATRQGLDNDIGEPVPVTGSIDDAGDDKNVP